MKGAGGGAGAGAGVAALSALALLFACTRTAEAAPRKNISDICAGCLATVPDDAEPAPLLVTLHGDWGPMAPNLHRGWEKFAAPRGVALLSLTCPAELGCKNKSWWQWNGEPSWIVAQIDRLAATRALDRDRMWIAGWSGGASYIGMRTQEIERTFAGIVIHGGGVWPWPDDCPAQKARVVFLVGDRNPLHKNGLVLREHYVRCGNEVTFHLLPGAEHEAEWKALDKNGGTILDELATARMTRPPPVVIATNNAATIATKVATSPRAPERATEPATVAAPDVQVRPRAGCGCDVGPRREGTIVVILPGLVFVVRRRRSSVLR